MQKFTDKTLMPFGQHKGTALVNVPAASLLWYYDNIKLSEPLKMYIEDNMQVLRQQSKSTYKNNAR